MSGRLVLVGTPLGNLGDLSSRAVEALAAADVVACEDTRRTGRLLELSGVGHRPLVVVNEHTESDAVAGLLDRLASGQVVALVSDAGMPAISDPGELVVRAALDAGFVVDTVPGPSAAITALAVSGLSTQRFVFEGFLPRRGADRDRRLTALADECRTVVLHEAPHRLARTLADLAVACGRERQVVLARELTKMHQELWRGTLAEACDQTAAVAPRGEYVVVVAGAPPRPPVGDDELLVALHEQLAAGASTRDAVDSVAARYAVARNRVYDLATRGPRS